MLYICSDGNYLVNVVNNVATNPIKVYHVKEYVDDFTCLIPQDVVEYTGDYKGGQVRINEKSFRAKLMYSFEGEWFVFVKLNFPTKTHEYTLEEVINFEKIKVL